MKIAISVSHFPQLAETFILNRITGLIDLGHEVDIYAYGPGSGDTVHEDVAKYKLLERVHYFSIPENKFKRVLVGVYRIVFACFQNPLLMFKSLNFKKYGKEVWSLKLPMAAAVLVSAPQYDVIHSHHGPNGLKDVWLKEIGAWRGGHAVSFHGADISRHIKLHGKNVYKKLFESADLFMPVSIQMKKDLVRLGCDAHKISIHHSGIELHKFGFDPEHDFAPGGVVRLLSVGRLVEKKGFFYSIQAVRQLVKEGCNLTYDIIGEGDEYARLKALIKKYTLENVIFLRGAQSQQNVIKALKTADIFLGPSVMAIDGNAEGIPNTLKEAMAVGLPVISTYHGSIEELITHGESGLLCRERNVDELVQAIKDMMNEEDQRWHYQHNARLIIEDEFSATALNQRLVKLYQRIQSNI